MSKDFSIGNMDQMVTIKTATKTPDLSKGHDASYSVLTTTWAAVERKSGVNVFNDGKLTEADEKDFYLYWRDAFSVINADTIFEHNGRKYKYQRPGEFIENQKVIIKYTTVGV